MAEDTILQHWIFSQFILPFLLIFALIYAILEKTKLFGDGKHQLNAIIAGVIGLIFVGAVYPKIVVGNMILFLTVAIVCVFVVMIIWGFIFGDIKEGFKPATWMKWVLGIVAGIAFIGAVLWATGWYSDAKNFLFDQVWSSAVWTNVAFILVIAIALALVLKTKKGS